MSAVDVADVEIAGERDRFSVHGHTGGDITALWNELVPIYMERLESLKTIQSIHLYKQLTMTAAKPDSIPEDTYEALIHATLVALSKTGYVNLRVRDIDAEFEKSRQLINHYFAGKDELVTETLSFLVEGAGTDFDSTTDSNPAKRLNDELDRALLGPDEEDEYFWMVATALYELQSQAQHNPRHQELFIQLTD